MSSMSSMSSMRAVLERIVLLPIGLLVLLWAHRGLALGGGVLADRGAAERWLFAADQAPTLPVIALCTWMVWRRRDALTSSSDGPRPILAGLLLVPALLLFAWAHHVGSADLLIPCLGLEMLGFAAAVKGRDGCRALLLPALVLLLAMPIPSPVYNEVVWRLQIWTTAGSSLLLALAGYDVQHADAMIRIGDRALVVVAACSGLRGMQLLLVAAVAIRELFASTGARMWCVVGVAPLLAMLMNVVRVASIALTDDPEVRVAIASGHLPQGIAVVTVGTFLLYLCGWLLARGRTTESPDRRASPVRGRTPSSVATVSSVSTPARWRLCAYATALALVSVWPTGAGPTPSLERVEPPPIAMHQGGWQGRELEHEWLATGELPLDPIVRRRYERAVGAVGAGGEGEQQVVELMIAWADAGRPHAHPFSPKLLLPGPEWSLEERRRARIWALDLEADLVRARSGSAQVVAYHWHVRDEGFWRATLRSLLGLDRIDAGAYRPRAVVRLATPLATTGQLARDRAKRSLDRFIGDFRDELAGL